ncbi:FAD-dependent oxidoreductase [Radicibacter daui]|uniref:FAD-dependent oxidoreductase n=1 Tax=Radicibacter daui TaxID=3064829 RepID=UPI004046902D
MTEWKSMDIDLLVVGGGPAGMAAAVEARQAGLQVLLVDQRERLGGAIYCQPDPGCAPVAMSARHRARWQALSREFAASGAAVEFHTSFAGLDSEGLALLERRASAGEAGRVLPVRARAVVLAVGAVERIAPLPGWELPGVMSAGGLQMMMKRRGAVPVGRTLLAGSGPLLLAVASQMVALGQPPVAIIERARPFGQPAELLKLLATPGYLREALAILARLHKARVPVLHATQLTSIRLAAGGGLEVECRGQGDERRFSVDRVALHDGIRPNDFGLPGGAATGGPVLSRAGDCREALGAVAAIEDGKRAGREAARMLGLKLPAMSLQPVKRERRAQAVLARLFSPALTTPPADLPDETVICRCENRTAGDLRGLLAGHDGLSAREVKLNGRFAMGSCQGRFCADATVDFLRRCGAGAEALEASHLTGRRWPVRPVGIATLLAEGGAAADPASVIRIEEE